MSCLFNSLSYFLKNVNSSQLRQLICTYLKTNPNILDDIPASDITTWENSTNLEDYIKKMSLNSTWGGAIEIKCFCELFKVDVKVKHKNRIISFTPNDPDVSKGTVTILYTGNHYEPDTKK